MAIPLRCAVAVTVKGTFLLKDVRIRAPTCGANARRPVFRAVVSHPIHGRPRLGKAAFRGLPRLGWAHPFERKEAVMADYPGWYQDPTGRHPERYFDSNGIPTQLVRSNGLEFMDADPALPAPLPAPIAPYRVPAGADHHCQHSRCPRYRPFHRHQSVRDASATGG